MYHAIKKAVDFPPVTQGRRQSRLAAFRHLAAGGFAPQAAEQTRRIKAVVRVRAWSSAEPLSPA